MLPPPVIVTLTTDFGLADGYVAAMKGAMLRVAPEIRLVDVTHDVAAQDRMEAAFVLVQTVPFMPDGSVHLVVVDPGVGTDRRGIAARIRRPDGEHYLYVGPDNGIASLLASDADAGGTVEAVAVLDRPDIWRTPTPSVTFHGRDVFGPVAARLAMGARLADVGTLADVPADAMTPLHWPLPIADAQGIAGMVLHVDRFGNCLTNIPRDAVDGRDLTVYIGATVIRGVSHTYASVAEGEPVALFGSSGHLEVAVRGGDAACLLSLKRGAGVTLIFGTSARPDAARRDTVRRRTAQPRTLA